MENTKELLRIDPNTKERWQWIRIVPDDSHSLEKPNARYVCEHLAREKDERVVEELAETASGDPGALDCHYTIRLCAACADIYETNEPRRNR